MPQPGVPERRKGIATNEVMVNGPDDVYVERKAEPRIGGLAGPSEVLASRTVRELTAVSGIAFEDAGEHDLKGVPTAGTSTACRAHGHRRVTRCCSGSSA